MGSNQAVSNQTLQSLALAAVLLGLILIRAPPMNVGGALLFSASTVRPSVCPSVRLSVVTLTQSFLSGFLQNFIYGLLPPTSRSSLNTGFVSHLITKMADKMAATYQYPLSWSL